MRFMARVTITEQYKVFVEAEDWEAAEDKVNSALAKMTPAEMVTATTKKTALPEGIDYATTEDDYSPDGGMTVEVEEDE